MNIFFNKDESRARAGFRVLIYLFIAFFLVGIGNSLPLNGYQYVLTGGIQLGFFWLMFRFMDNRINIREAGINLSKSWWQELGLGILLGVLAMALIFVVLLIGGGITISGFGWEAVTHSIWFLPVFIFFIQMVSVGFYEELISRSYLIVNLKEGFTTSSRSPAKATILAVIVSSTVFGLAHSGNPNVTNFALINIILAGIMLAVPYLLTGRLAYSVGIHFAWNFAQGGIFGFRVSGLSIRNSIIQTRSTGVDWWTGGSFGPEGGLIGTLAIIVLIISLVVLIRLRGNKKLELDGIFTSNFFESNPMKRNRDS